MTEHSAGPIRLSCDAASRGAALLIERVLLMASDGPVEEIRLAAEAVDPARGHWRATGTSNGFNAALEVVPLAGRQVMYEGRLEVRRVAPTTVERGLRLVAELAGGGEPTWLIPGCFYGENRVAGCRVLYPRYDASTADAAGMQSSWWAFGSDRAAVPVVFGWNDGICAGLRIVESSTGVMTGLGFGRDISAWRWRGPAASRDATAVGDGHDPCLWVDVPAREEPISYDGTPEAAPPTHDLLTWRSGEREIVTFQIYLAGPDRHSYAAYLRIAEELDRPQNPLAPWVDADAATHLTASGLMRWHLRPDPPRLIETAAFQRDLRGAPIIGEDRTDMHIAWLSGTPSACALLRHGRRVRDNVASNAAAEVLDTCAAALSPSGFFWGAWREGRGWTGGWNPQPHWVHARTLAEATLFLLRAIATEREAGVDRPEWEAAVRSNIRALLRVQHGDGRFGTYYDALTGAVTEWDGSGGMLWIAALLEAADLLNDGSLRGPAVAAGEAYAADVEREWLYGAPEDVHLAPSSEDGYVAVMAYVALLERDGDATRRTRWLDLATRAAEWTLTFRWTANITFAAHTLLGHYRFASRGADAASPANPHLHGYGLVCAAEMVRLAQHTGDDYFRRRALDHIACFRQFIARRDGDFNARRGMVTERYYHTRAFAPKGSLLPLSHAWCAGLTLYANTAELEDFRALP